MITAVTPTTPDVYKRQAQRTCDKMVMEAEAKCAKMLSNANAAAAAQAAQNVQRQWKRWYFYQLTRPS